MIAHDSVAGHAVGVSAVLLATATYAWCWSHTRARSTRSLAAWAGASAAWLVATAPAAERAAARTFTAHMWQHLAMVVVVAPLVVAARPMRTAAEGLGVRVRPVGAAARDACTLAAPLAICAFVLGVHVTDAYDAALRSAWVHDLEHAGFLAAGLAVWHGLAMRREGGVLAVVTSFATIVGLAVVGMILVTAGQPLSDVHAARLGAAAAVADQRSGVTLMWVGGMLTAVPALLTSVWRWAVADQRRTERREALVDR